MSIAPAQPVHLPAPLETAPAPQARALAFDAARGWAMKREKQKGRREAGSFSAIPHAVQNSENYRACGGSAIKVLLYLVQEYRGNNNGKLAAILSDHPAGIKSSDTLSRALRKLEQFHLIQKTRQGGKNKASLYALTWHPIDCSGVTLDVPTTKVASGIWKLPAEPVSRCVAKNPCSGIRSKSHRNPEQSQGSMRRAAPESGVVRPIFGKELLRIPNTSIDIPRGFVDSPLLARGWRVGL
ncbi:MAG: hypothetical protein QM599_03440 [Pseudoxanthomonas sp.]